MTVLARATPKTRCDTRYVLIFEHQRQNCAT